MASFYNNHVCIYKNFLLFEWPVHQRVRVASVNEVLPGKGKEICVAGQIIALFRIGQQFYALDGVCHHQGGPLADGTVQQKTLTCPWHGWQYDLETGENLVNAKICQQKYQVEVTGNDIFVVVNDADTSGKDTHSFDPSP